MFRHLGVFPILRYLFSLHNPRNLKKKLYDVAHRIKPFDRYAPGGCGQLPQSFLGWQPCACDPDGSQLPQLFLDWQTGLYPPELIRDTMITFIDENPQFFANRTEQNLIRASVHAIFTPEILAAATQPIQKGIKLVQSCKNRGMRVFILSNFDTKTLGIIRQNNPELFELFDEDCIFVSSSYGIMKPGPQIYELLLYQHNLDPTTCVFFDDQQENIDAAQACDINGILVKKKNGWFRSWPDIATARKRFERLLASNVKQAVLA